MLQKLYDLYFGFLELVITHTKPLIFTIRGYCIMFFKT